MLPSLMGSCEFNGEMIAKNFPIGDSLLVPMMVSVAMLHFKKTKV